MPAAPPIGETTVGKGATVRLFRDASGFLLQFSDTGTFRISEREIIWWPGSDGASEAARVDVKGRVIPLALHLGGSLCLHAGAVMIAGSVIALTGPKRVGKSTLTASLVAAGAEFVTDDVLAVSGPPEPKAVSGFGSFRLWVDSANQVSLSSAYSEPGLGGKLNVRAAEPKGLLAREGVPLAAVYLLRPADPKVMETPKRRRLSERNAAVALVGSVKNGEILGGDEQTRVFELASACARAVACYELAVPRDLDLLSHAAEEIFAWHSGSGDRE
jgi:hypothetical protein